ncbi:hypothetical protein V6N13_025123 [Hibiscus sabdariffa]|uniref:Secreted protein n=1 Tax=Hibiscus sabdariffa TaxID=183260 RepID=A0ABR2NM97_9ROSI
MGFFSSIFCCCCRASPVSGEAGATGNHRPPSPSTTPFLVVPHFPVTPNLLPFMIPPGLPFYYKRSLLVKGADA